MINSTMTNLLSSPNGKSFLEWYITKYTNLQVFKDLPFEQQLGTILVYLEAMWGFSLIADNTGYISYYTSTFSEGSITKLTDRFKTNNFYHIHSINGEPKDVIYYYAMGVTELFNNLDIPF